MSRRINRAVKGALDPLLQNALQMEGRPIIPGRAWANDEAAALTSMLERIAARAAGEPDRNSAGQLMNIAEAFGACAVSLVAYSRGVVPGLASKPDATIILDS